ncbi:hypothetical protein Tco_1139922, partial [Tanacetum coccineum]
MKATMAWRCHACDIIIINVIPPDHVDDVPVVKLNQHDDVPVIPEPVLVDEDEDPKEEEFEEEEEPQEEEDDMEVDIEEDENEPELTYLYKEVDPPNPPSPASELEHEDVIEVEDMVESEDEIVPASVQEVGESSTAPFLREDSDGLLHDLKRRTLTLFLVGWILFQDDCVVARWRMHWSRRRERQRMNIMLVEKLGNAEEKVECKKLKKELEEARGFMFEERPNEAIDVLIEDEKRSPRSRLDAIVRDDSIMPPKSAPMTQAAICRMIKESVDAAIAAERARQANVRNDASRFGPVRGRDTEPAIRECTFAGFMKCNPAAFRGIGVVELRRWFEKTKSVFEISECAEGKKVKFAAATLEGPTLTWWKTKVA